MNIVLWRVKTCLSSNIASFFSFFALRTFPFLEVFLLLESRLRLLRQTKAYVPRVHRATGSKREYLGAETTKDVKQISEPLGRFFQTFTGMSIVLCKHQLARRLINSKLLLENVC